MSAVVAVTAAAVTAVPHQSFAEKIEAGFKRLFGHAPTYAGIATSTITFVAPLVLGVTALVDPAALPVVQPIVIKIQSALAAANVVIKDAGPQATIATYLQSVTSNLGQLESAAQIKNTDQAAKLTGLVTLISGEVQALLARLQPQAS